MDGKYPVYKYVKIENKKDGLLTFTDITENDYNSSNTTGTDTNSYIVVKYNDKSMQRYEGKYVKLSNGNVEEVYNFNKDEKGINLKKQSSTQPGSNKTQTDAYEQPQSTGKTTQVNGTQQLNQDVQPTSATQVVEYEKQQSIGNTTPVESSSPTVYTVDFETTDLTININIFKQIIDYAKTEKEQKKQSVNNNCEINNDIFNYVKSNIIKRNTNPPFNVLNEIADKITTPRNCTNNTNSVTGFLIAIDICYSIYGFLNNRNQLSKLKDDLTTTDKIDSTIKAVGGFITPTIPIMYKADVNSPSTLLEIKGELQELKTKIEELTYFEYALEHQPLFVDLDYKQKVMEQAKIDYESCTKVDQNIRSIYYIVAMCNGLKDYLDSAKKKYNDSKVIFDNTKLKPPQISNELNKYIIDKLTGIDVISKMIISKNIDIKAESNKIIATGKRKGTLTKELKIYIKMFYDVLNDINTFRALSTQYIDNNNIPDIKQVTEKDEKIHNLLQTCQNWGTVIREKLRKDINEKAAKLKTRISEFIDDKSKIHSMSSHFFTVTNNIDVDHTAKSYYLSTEDRRADELFSGSQQIIDSVMKKIDTIEEKIAGLKDVVKGSNTSIKVLNDVTKGNDANKSGLKLTIDQISTSVTTTNTSLTEIGDLITVTEEELKDADGNVKNLQGLIDKTGEELKDEDGNVKNQQGFEQTLIRLKEYLYNEHKLKKDVEVARDNEEKIKKELENFEIQKITAEELLFELNKKDDVKIETTNKTVYNTGEVKTEIPLEKNESNSQGLNNEMSSLTNKIDELQKTINTKKIELSTAEEALKKKIDELATTVNDKDEYIDKVFKNYTAKASVDTEKENELIMLSELIENITNKIETANKIITRASSVVNDRIFLSVTNENPDITKTEKDVNTDTERNKRIITISTITKEKNEKLINEIKKLNEILENVNDADTQTIHEKITKVINSNASVDEILRELEKNNSELNEIQKSLVQTRGGDNDNDNTGKDTTLTSNNSSSNTSSVGSIEESTQTHSNTITNTDVYTNLKQKSVSLQEQTNILKEYREESYKKIQENTLLRFCYEIYKASITISELKETKEELTRINSDTMADVNSLNTRISSSKSKGGTIRKRNKSRRSKTRKSR